MKKYYQEGLEFGRITAEELEKAFETEEQEEEKE